MVDSSIRLRDRAFLTVKCSQLFINCSCFPILGNKVDEDGEDRDADSKERPLHLIRPLPKTTCNRPLRLGLSRKYSHKRLHPYFKKRSNENRADVHFTMVNRNGEQWLFLAFTVTCVVWNIRSAFVFTGYMYVLARSRRRLWPLMSLVVLQSVGLKNGSNDAKGCVLLFT